MTMHNDHQDYIAGRLVPTTSHLEYRSLELVPSNDNKRLQSANYVEGVATTFDKSYLLYEYGGHKYYEVIGRNALEDADMSDVIFQYNHGGKVLARMSNNTLLLDVTASGLVVCADLSKSKQAREMYHEISAGLVTKMSIGFTVAESSYNKETRTRTIHKIKRIYDVSGVSHPANPDTSIEARSHLLDHAVKHEQQAKQRQLLLLKTKLAQ